MPVGRAPRVKLRLLQPVKVGRSGQHTASQTLAGGWRRLGGFRWIGGSIVQSLPIRACQRPTTSSEGGGTVPYRRLD